MKKPAAANTLSSKSNSPYFEYLDFLSQSGTKKKYKDSALYLNQFSFINQMNKVLPCAIYMLDYQTQEYLFFSKNCKMIFGYTPQEFKKNKLQWSLKQIHPDDLVFLTDKIFSSILDYYKTLSADEIKKTKFSVNYRDKRKDGKYIQILQQWVILESDKSGPLLVLGFDTDISAYKTDDKIIFTISKYNEEKGFTIISSDSYHTNRLNISKREKDVLTGIVEGLTTKGIAGKLYISAHTVKIHRKNLMKKTGTGNAAELVNFVIANGLI